MTSQYIANKFGNTYGTCKKNSEARPPSHPYPIFSGLRPFRKLANSPIRPIRDYTISSTRPGTVNEAVDQARQRIRVCVSCL